MAKFKERLKMIFKSKLVRALSIIILCIIGMIALSRCSKVEAAAITLPDGTVSKVDLNKSQVFNDKGFMGNMRLVFNGDKNAIVYSPINYIYIYYNCSLSSNILACSGYKTITNTGNVTTNENYVFNFEIGYDTVNRIQVSNNWTTTFYLDTYGDNDLNASYELGYNAGLSDSQEEVYNNGYIAGENAGLSAGYNNGYNEGQKTGYNTGFSEGQNSVDITVDNEEAINIYCNDNICLSVDEYNTIIENEITKERLVIINPYEEGNINYDYWNIGVYDAYTCYLENGWILNECFNENYIDFNAYEEGLSLIVGIIQKDKTKLDNINDLSTILFNISYVEGQENGYQDGKLIGYKEALEDADAFLGFIPTTLGGVVSNVMPILTYEVYGISIMNVVGLIAMIGLAIVIVKFIVG